VSLPQRSFRIVRTADDPLPTEPDTLLTVKEVAARLKVGTSTVYRLCDQTPPALPVVRFPGAAVVRISRRALEDLIRRQTAAAGPTADRSAGLGSAVD